MRTRFGVMVVLVLVLGVASDASAAPRQTAGSCRKNACVTPDTTAPAVAISTPAEAATVSGAITVSGTATDAALAFVDVSVDGGASTRATGTSSWSTVVDTRTLANGAHSITARATDTSGNAAVATRTVQVANQVADTTPPTVSITSPASGATVDGVVTVSGSAGDDAGVARVEVSIDGGAFTSASGTGSWSRSWDSTSATDGAHTIRARAVDAAGNVSSVASRSVTVANATNPGGGSIAPSTQGTWVSPEGVTISVSTAGPWTIDVIYRMLLENARDLDRIGPSLTVKVQDSTPSQTATSVSLCSGAYCGFRATLTLQGVGSTFASKPDYIAAHEYGHVWTMYHRYLSQRGSWDTYLRYRWANADGSVRLADDSRLGSSYSWSTAEIVADDYRLLFGSTKAISQKPTHLNTTIPDPRNVPGLGTFLGQEFAQ